MNLAKTIEELPRWKPTIHLDGSLLDDCSDCEEQNGRLVATLRKCETAIDSLPVETRLHVGGESGSRWKERDELLSEIREVLDAK